MNAPYRQGYTPTMDAHTLDIRNALTDLIDRAPAGGFWHLAETEPSARNAFALQLVPGGPIFTVEIRAGGAITTRG